MDDTFCSSFQRFGKLSCLVHKDAFDGWCCDRAGKCKGADYTEVCHGVVLANLEKLGNA
jgi:hypothetical protein